jgi:hypothetical protein
MSLVVNLNEYRQGRVVRHRDALPVFVGPRPCNNKRNVNDIDEWIEPATRATNGKLLQRNSACTTL